MKRLLIIANEPSPYMTDLHNALAAHGGWEVFVCYPFGKDWGPDSGHDYRIFPERHYGYHINTGRGWSGQMRSAWDVYRKIMGSPHAVMINGYTSIVHISALLLCWAFNKPFVLWGDYFNNSVPQGLAARWTRARLRQFVFRHAAAVLSCGKMGTASAIEAGCPTNKVIDFPYVVSEHRLLKLSIEFEQKSGAASPTKRISDAPVILFSGRFIPRKGLSTLLYALQKVRLKGYGFHLLIEGDGPLRNHHHQLVQSLDLQEYCSFLGFCQMDQHAWLLAQADVVVVPSLHDPWGIVVHEGMLMGKAVCAARSVGSAIDRIEHGKNGLLSAPNNPDELAEQLLALLPENACRHRLGIAAQQLARQWSPERNAAVLFGFLEQRPR